MTNIQTINYVIVSHFIVELCICSSLLPLAGGLNNRSIAINKKSAIDNLIPIFIPPELTTSTLKTHFSCNAPQHSQPGHENHQNTHFKIHKITFLLMNSKDGVNRSTQNMLNNFV